MSEIEKSIQEAYDIYRLFYAKRLTETRGYFKYLPFGKSKVERAGLENFNRVVQERFKDLLWHTKEDAEFDEFYSKIDEHIPYYLNKHCCETIEDLYLDYKSVYEDVSNVFSYLLLYLKDEPVLPTLEKDMKSGELFETSREFIAYLDYLKSGLGFNNETKVKKPHEGTHRINSDSICADDEMPEEVSSEEQEPKKPWETGEGQWVSVKQENKNKSVGEDTMGNTSFFK